MIAIKLYYAKKFYHNKWGEIEYLDGTSDITYYVASILSDKKIEIAEHHLYTAYGDTNEEAMKSMKNYLKANPTHPKLHRYEIENVTTTKQ